MIFVTVGTSTRPFDRLVQAAEQLGVGDEQVFVQYGVGRPPSARLGSSDFLVFSAFEQKVRDARIVVAHAGVGTLSVCLRHGKRPILVPRRKALGEQVDDHQVGFVRRVGELRLATVLEDPSELARAIASICPDLGPLPGASNQLTSELVEQIWYAVLHRDTERHEPGPEKAKAAPGSRLRWGITERRLRPAANDDLVKIVGGDGAALVTRSSEVKQARQLLPGGWIKQPGSTILEADEGGSRCGGLPSTSER